MSAGKRGPGRDARGL